jgi:predicted naringenin-chalcone synthase
MSLSGQVPLVVERALRADKERVLAGAPASSVAAWAVHPGGQSVLNAVEAAFNLAPTALCACREVLRQFGNMSSATIMFVLKALLQSPVNGAAGCAISFGPGLIAEAMLFRPTAFHLPTQPGLDLRIAEEART